MADASVHLRPPGLPWQVLGKELYEGVNPSQVRVEADTWGFATCSFELVRDPFLPQPDLSSFVPCVIDEGPYRLFEGKVMETPTRGEPEPSINVSGKGYQHVLDENPIEFCWCHADLSAWKDVRGLPGYPVATWRPGGTVEVGDGAITLGRSQGDPWFGNEGQGVYLDLGPDQRATRIEIQWESTNLAGNGVFQLYCRGTLAVPSAVTGFGDGAFGGPNQANTLTPSVTHVWSDAVAMPGGPSSNNRVGYFRPPARLIAIFLWWVGAGGGTPVGFDHLLKITRLRLYGDSQLGAGVRGNLRASDVVADVIERGAPQLVVPEQQHTEDATYADELYTCVAGIAGNYYPLDLPNRLAPAWASLAGNLDEGGTPTYTSTGGPLLDGTDSAYASFPAPFLKYLAIPAPPWPAAYPGWALVVWFRTTMVGAGGPGFNLLNNRIVSTDMSGTLPVAGTIHFGVGINPSGGLTWGTIDSVGSVTTVTYSGAVNDGQWHMLFLSYSSDISTLQVALDDTHTDGAEYSRSLGFPIATIDPTPRLHFATRYGGDVQFRGDLAEIAWFYNEIPVRWAKHLWRAARRDTSSTVHRTLTVLPGFATTAPRNSRDLIEPVNAVHRYVTKVGRDRQTEFHPQPVRPKYALTAAASRKFEQTSLTAADEAYNRALVVGNDESGLPVRIERVTGQLPNARLIVPRQVAAVNPSATVNAANWQQLSGGGLAISRDTGGAQSAPASILVNAAGYAGIFNVNASVFTSFQGTFLRGRLYRLVFYTWTQPGVSGRPFTAWLGNLASGDYAVAGGAWDAGGSWVARQIDWIPGRDWPADTMASGIAFNDAAWFCVECPQANMAGLSPGTFWVDSLDLRIGVASMLDRLDDLRTRTIETSAVLTDAIGTSMADAFLMNRARQQLRGAVEVGYGDVVDYLSGNLVAPAKLVEDTTELLHLPSLHDPDTGSEGRDGQMVAVSYEPETETASVTIDNSRDNFEILAQRYAMFLGGRVEG